MFQFLQEVSILDKPAEKRSVEGPGAGQTPHAGWFNRLVQYGRSDHETKTCGSHGGLDSPTVSVSLLGNFHPTPAIEMVRGLRGDHGCQAKARLMIVTGLPVQPHESYTLVNGEVCHRKWRVVPDEIRNDLNLGDHGDNVRAFTAYYAPEPVGILDEFDEDTEEYFNREYIPDETGYDHVLPDGVTIGVRMRLVNNRYRLEWAVPDRTQAPVSYTHLTLPTNREV